MRGISVAALLLAFATTACRAREAAAPPAAPPVSLPQSEGTLAVGGLRAPVSVVRDEWGVPHITATSADDLFFAQGFVQAQDRLFQMDLWRRASLGRLSEVLGANFVQRDSMTRRVQYKGDLDVEWAAYGPDAKAVVTAFVRGINAWIDHSRDTWPDEFRLAGWQPEPWAPEDLLNRTDAFAVSRGVDDEVFCAEMLASKAIPLPMDPCRLAEVSRRIDLAAVPHALVEMPRRVGARPFFAGFAAPFGGSNAWAVAGSGSASSAPILAADPHRTFEAPALRYLVHLDAPGWHVAGATSPWLPGVAIGHNEHIAWATTAMHADLQDVYVERVNPANPREVEYQGRWEAMTVRPDSFPVKGRPEPFEYEQQSTRHGPVIGIDRERNLAYALKWPGDEPGMAAELGVLRLNRAASLAEASAAIAQWRMPAVEFVVAARDGVRAQRAGFEPRRQGFRGLLPAEGWSGRNEWIGPSRSVADAPTSTASPAVSTNDDPIRASTISRATSGRALTVGDAMQIQRDVHAGAADVLLPQLERVAMSDSALAEAKRRLLAWDRRVDASEEARLFVAWEEALDRMTASRNKLSSDLAEVTIRRWPSLAARVSMLRRAGALTDSQRMMADALQEALASTSKPGAANEWAAGHQITFAHPLAISDQARQRFNVGAFPMDGYDTTVQLISAGGRVGPGLRVVFDLANWDTAQVINAPGQSGSPDSVHYKDLAALWAEGKMVPLPFTPAAVQRAAKATLTLQPK